MNDHISVFSPHQLSLQEALGCSKKSRGEYFFKKDVTLWEVSAGAHVVQIISIKLSFIINNSTLHYVQPSSEVEKKVMYSICAHANLCCA